METDNLGFGCTFEGVWGDKWLYVSVYTACLLMYQQFCVFKF